MPYSISRSSTNRKPTGIQVEPETEPPTSKGDSGTKHPTGKKPSASKSSSSKSGSGAKLPTGKSHSAPKSSTSKSYPAKQNVTAKNHPATNSSTSERRPDYEHQSVPYCPCCPTYMDPTTGQNYAHQSVPYCPCCPTYVDPTTGQNYAGPSSPMMENDPVKRLVTVLRIPYSTPSMELLTVRLSEPISTAVSESSQCEQEEDRLGRIPTLWHIPSKSFEWQDRSLTKIPAAEAGPKCEHDYFMYKCKNSQVGLEANKYFAPCRGPRIYGDAFVFRVNAGCIDGHTQGAEYVDMDLGFVKELQSMGPVMSIVARLAELKKPGTGYPHS